MHASGRRGEWTRHSLCIFSLDRRRQASRATVVPQRKCSLTAAGCALITATMLGSRPLGAHRCNLLRKCSTGRLLAYRAGVAAAGAISARRSPRGEFSEHGARHVRRVGSSSTRSGERRGPPRWRRARAAAASVIRSVHRDPCKCTARSSNPRCSEKHWAPTLPNARSARAGLHSSPAGFAQFACTVRTDDTLLRATLMWVLEPRSLRSRNEFSRISSHSGTERVSAYHKG
jgi:hypothetical protein